LKPDAGTVQVVAAVEGSNTFGGEFDVAGGGNDFHIVFGGWFVVGRLASLLRTG
jgi:hypothetical protein